MGPRAVALAVSSVVLAGLLSPPAPASAADAPYSSLQVRSDPTDDSTEVGTTSYDRNLDVTGTLRTVTAVADGAYLVIDAPGEEELQVGRRYTGAVRASFNNNGEPGLDWGGCSRNAGSFTIHSIAAGLDGQVESVVASFESHCDGRTLGDHGVLAWNSPTPPPPPPPVLVVGLTSRHLAYNTTARGVAILSADSPVRGIAVYAQVPGGTPQLVASGDVDAGGRLPFAAKLTETTVLTVTFDGGNQFEPRSRSVTAEVAARVTSRLRGSTRSSGRFAIYPARREPVLVTRVRPAHAGDCIDVRIQARVRGRWGYDDRVKCLRLDDRSRSGLRLVGGARLVGVPLRMRAEWRGDDRNGKETGSWRYLRFVG